MSQEFYDAATFGNVNAVRQMLASDPALARSAVEWGFTALHGVAGEEQFEMAAFLLDAGTDPNARNDKGITPLHLAAYPEMVELLVRRGADINVRSNDGETPLLVQAAEAEGYEVMEALLRLGADADATDNRGRSALDLAQAREEKDKIRLLKKYGATETSAATKGGGVVADGSPKLSKPSQVTAAAEPGASDVMRDSRNALNVDYGVQCHASDEKKLVKNVNLFLASLNFRKVSKRKDTSIQPPERTFRIAHFYCQFLKQHPRWYFDLRPNVDLDGKSRFPNHPDCGWILFTRKSHPETYSTKDHDTLNSFFAQLIEALGFPTRVIHVYEEKEDRL